MQTARKDQELRRVNWPVFFPTGDARCSAVLRVDPRVCQAQAIMRQDIHRKLDVSELAVCVGLSASWLSHLFKTRIGLTPARYLKSLRVEKAREILETSALSVKEVTALVGLVHVSRFIQDFKNRYQVTPARYRLQRWQENLDAGERRQQNLDTNSGIRISIALALHKSHDKHGVYNS
jgi:transcriptional regulator GlxA family with amidase domain